MDKLIVNYTPTGMLLHKNDTKHVPILPKEIIEDVKRATSIGITSVHLHARNRDESPCWEKEVYKEIILGIREYNPELVISVTTSGRFSNTFETRSDVLNLDGDAKPDMASLTLSSLNFNRTSSINDPDMIVSLARKMQDCGIKPELEAFDCGMINYAKYLIKKEYLQPPYYFSLILGNIACAQPSLLHSGMLINDLPEESIVALGGIGRAQLPINTVAIAMGYGVRVGLEDNIWLDDERTILATNQDYLSRIHRIAKEFGREICTSSDLRRILKLKPGKGIYGC